MNQKLLAKVIAYFGSKRQLAEALQLHPQNIHNWIKGKQPIPMSQAYKIERLTHGKFQWEQLAKANTEIMKRTK